MTYVLFDGRCGSRKMLHVLSFEGNKETGKMMMIITIWSGDIEIFDQYEAETIYCPKNIITEKWLSIDIITNSDMKYVLQVVFGILSKKHCKQR